MDGTVPGGCIAVIFLVITGCSALYENCDYYQNMQLGKTYYVYSPEYPNKYPPGMSCRFYAVSPPKTRIDLNCEDISIPPVFGLEKSTSTEPWISKCETTGIPDSFRPTIIETVPYFQSKDCYYDRLAVSKSGDPDMIDSVNYCGKGSIKIRSDINKMSIVAIASKASPGGSFLCSIRAIPVERKCECGWKNQERIVGGTETGVNEFPMMAGLVDFVERELFCAATIISPKYAVTAAHCLTARNAHELGLLVGDHDLSTGNDTNSAKLHRITKAIIHPSYSTVSHVHDIGLVQVDGKIQFSRRVGPACLPFLNVGDRFVGEEVVALGWGATRFSGSSSNKLMKVDLDVISNGKCREAYINKIIDDQICTYKDNKDACQNDSGGPLLWMDHESGRMKLLGIISYGIQCATEHPSVNTRVTSYVDWIRSRTGEEYCMV